MWWTVAYLIVFTVLAWLFFQKLTNRYETEITRLKQDQNTIETVTQSFENTLTEQRTLLFQLRTERDAKSEMIDTYINEIERLHNEVRHQKGRAASQATSKGQALEKWAPFVDHPNIDTDWKIENWSFLGSPIDYIVWHYSTNKEDNIRDGKVVFLDVKAGKSGLTTKQRRIRDIIEAGNVEWRTIRLD
jgi:predicted Holliday junction resolvase-like endonuclease|tara:strand:+ start:1462 stop:2028 length:567 start_codon:yes stop_codon:yes gene_type:complete